jgi:hypothetical protein
MDTLRILTGGRSHSVRLLALLPLLPWAHGAYAANVVTLPAGADVMIGSDGSAGGTIEGPAVSLNLSGDAATNFSSGAPGSSLNPSVYFLDFSAGFGAVTLAGQQTICSLEAECALQVTEVTGLQSLTFPTNDQSFSVTVPASMAPIMGQAGSQPEVFSLQTAPGELSLTFGFSGFPSPSYVFEQAQFVSSVPVSTPEPGTLGLMMAGTLIGTLAVMLKRKACGSLSAICATAPVSRCVRSVTQLTATGQVRAQAAGMIPHETVATVLAVVAMLVGGIIALASFTVWL